MKKIILTILFLVLSFSNLNSKTKVNIIHEGNIDSKVQLIVYESLTCGHCANFHKNIYPNLKKDFIDKGLLKIEFRNFPLDAAAFNASKVAHCKNDGKSDILHFLFNKQEVWAKGDTVEQFNLNLKELINKENFGIDFDKCLNNKEIEDHVLNDRIEGTKKFNVNATPTIIINNKKFDKPINYKNIKKSIEKLI